MSGAAKRFLVSAQLRREVREAFMEHDDLLEPTFGWISSSKCQYLAEDPKTGAEVIEHWLPTGWYEVKYVEWKFIPGRQASIILCPICDNTVDVKGRDARPEEIWVSRPRRTAFTNINTRAQFVARPKRPVKLTVKRETALRILLSEYIKPEYVDSALYQPSEYFYGKSLAEYCQFGYEDDEIRYMVKQMFYWKKEQGQ